MPASSPARRWPCTAAPSWTNHHQAAGTHARIERNAVELVVCGGRGGRAQARRGIRAPGRAVIVRDFGFRGNKAANKLRNYHDHGPGRDAARTNRTERARVARRGGGGAPKLMALR